MGVLPKMDPSVVCGHSCLVRDSRWLSWILSACLSWAQESVVHFANPALRSLLAQTLHWDPYLSRRSWRLLKYRDLPSSNKIDSCIEERLDDLMLWWDFEIFRFFNVRFSQLFDLATLVGGMLSKVLFLEAARLICKRLGLPLLLVCDISTDPFHLWLAQIEKYSSQEFTKVT